MKERFVFSEKMFSKLVVCFFFLEIDFDNESLTCFKLIAAAYSAERTVGLTFDFFFLLLVA